MFGRLLITVMIVSLSWFQDPATPMPRQSTAQLIVPQLVKGTIHGNTYRNPSIGLELTADPSLKFQSPELKDGGTKRQSLSVAALGKLKSGKAREGTFIGVIALAAYPEDQRTTDSCVQRIAEAQQKDGFKRAGNSSTTDLGHTTFARSDFLREGPVYEATFVKACDAQALVIVYSGPDQNTVEKFIAATGLKLDPSSSGCRSELVH